MSATPAAPVHKKKHGEETTGEVGTFRPSLRSGFTPYTCSPRGPGFLAPVARKSSPCERSASVGAPGPHDFVVRIRAVRLDALPRPPHPVPTSVTTAKRPSCGTGCPGQDHVFLKNGSDIFLAEGLDRANHVETKGEISLKNLVSTRAEIAARGDNLDITWFKDRSGDPEDELETPEEIATAIEGHFLAAVYLLSRRSSRN